MQPQSADRRGKVQGQGPITQQRLTKPLYWVLFCAFLLIGLGGIESCQAQRKHQKRGKQPAVAPVAVPVRPVMVCRLSTGMGFGAIPLYAAEIYRPGKLVYYGWKRTPKTGRYGYALQEAFVKNLLAEAKKAKLLALPAQHNAPPDAPVDTLFLMVDGKARTITFTPVDCDPALRKFTDDLRANLNAILEEQEPAESPADSTKR